MPEDQVQAPRESLPSPLHDLPAELPDEPPEEPPDEDELPTADELQEQEGNVVPRSLVLGMVEAAMRPRNLDVVELREALLGAAELGYDPSDLYREAAAVRPPRHQALPPLSKVLPPSFLKQP